MLRGQRPGKTICRSGDCYGVRGQVRLSVGRETVTCPRPGKTICRSGDCYGVRGQVRLSVGREAVTG